MAGIIEKLKSFIEDIKGTGVALVALIAVAFIIAEISKHSEEGEAE